MERRRKALHGQITLPIAPAQVACDGFRAPVAIEQGCRPFAERVDRRFLPAIAVVHDRGAVAEG